MRTEQQSLDRSENLISINDLVKKVLEDDLTTDFPYPLLEEVGTALHPQRISFRGTPFQAALWTQNSKLCWILANYFMRFSDGQARMKEQALSFYKTCLSDSWRTPRDTALQNAAFKSGDITQIYKAYIEIRGLPENLEMIFFFEHAVKMRPDLQPLLDERNKQCCWMFLCGINATLQLPLNGAWLILSIGTLGLFPALLEGLAEACHYNTTPVGVSEIRPEGLHFERTIYMPNNPGTLGNSDCSCEAAACLPFELSKMGKETNNPCLPMAGARWRYRLYNEAASAAAIQAERQQSSHCSPNPLMVQ